jgi:CRP-like cAMP-binding protein
MVLIPPRRTSSEKVKLLALSSIFEGISRDTLGRIAGQFDLIPFRAGENIATCGERGDCFYIIALGRAKVLADDSIMAVLGKGDYFGEISLLTGRPRNATIQAISDGFALALDKGTFLDLIKQEPSVNQRLENVLRVRPTVTQLTFLQGLSGDQLTRLSMRFSKIQKHKGDRVIKQKERGDAFFVLASGKATVFVRDRKGNEEVVAKLGPGSVFGEIALFENIPRTATVEITSDSAELLQLKKEDFHNLMESIPSLNFYLNRLSSERLRRLARTTRKNP